MKWNRLLGCVSFILMFLFLSTNFCQSQTQEPHHDASDLAKATQNPVSDVISIQFQFG